MFGDVWIAYSPLRVAGGHLYWILELCLTDPSRGVNLCCRFLLTDALEGWQLCEDSRLAIRKSRSLIQRAAC